MQFNFAFLMTQGKNDLMNQFLRATKTSKLTTKSIRSKKK
jgi:hypothetical protein